MASLELPSTTGSDNSGLSPEVERIFSATLFTIIIILPPTVIILGLVGNILVFVVFRQPQYAKKTTCLYMRVLAIFDSASLLSRVTIRTLINYNLNLCSVEKLNLLYVLSLALFSWHCVTFIELDNIRHDLWPFLGDPIPASGRLVVHHDTMQDHSRPDYFSFRRDFHPGDIKRVQPSRTCRHGNLPLQHFIYSVLHT
jgi:hypothetical protein